MLAECYLKPAAETPSSSLDEVERLIQNALPEGDENAIICMEMLLRALQVAPRGQGRVSKQELHGLKLITSPSSNSSDLKTASSDESADDLHFRVMVLCYSKLSYDYKSCLQYLTAFLNEKSISRTSLVRRWAAERLVGVAKEDEKQSHEKAAENCFNELVFRGFISPVEHGAAGNKVKSCMMRGQVKEFIEQISKSENFEGSHLPTHLDNHLRIRQMVDAQQKKLEQAQDQHSADAAACPSPNTCGLFSLQIRKQEDNRPIDELLNHLRSFPETYRLNVLDLGGCRGLKERHLKSICDCKTMQTLRYLSLRNTDVSSLPKQIRELWLLETLDIRETKIQASCTESIHLRKLKHLLAGDGSTARRTGEALSTVRMPTNISKMTDMEV
jgi:Leucine-rich repeat (LRR) protein